MSIEFYHLCYLYFSIVNTTKKAFTEIITLFLVSLKALAISGRTCNDVHLRSGGTRREIFFEIPNSFTEYLHFV